MTDRKQDLFRFLSSMLMLAVPIALQNMLTSCAGLVDTGMVARLGNVATSAVGLANRCQFLLQMLLFGICSGGSVLISQYWGAQDHHGVRRAYSLGAVLSVGAAAVFTAIALRMPYGMLCLFTDEEAVRLAGAEYLRIACLGAIPLSFVNIVCMARRSVEDVKLALITSAVAVLTNTGLNWCLIYGKLGFPQLGLKGAAIATVTSQVVQLILVVAVGLRQRHFTVYGLAEITRISRSFIWKYLKIALPVICNEFLWGAAFNTYAAIYARQGSENYAAYTLYSSIEQLVFVFFVGACNACGILIGKSIGQELIEDAKAIARKTLGLFVAMGAVLGLGLFLIRWPILDLMGVETAYTAKMAASILAFYCAWCPLRQLNYVLIVGILRAGGDTRVSAFLDVGVTLFWGVPAAWALAYVLKVPFFWLVCGTFVAEDIVKLPLCLWRMRSGKWVHSLTVE